MGDVVHNSCRLANTHNDTIIAIVVVFTKILPPLAKGKSYRLAKTIIQRNSALYLRHPITAEAS